MDWLTRTWYKSPVFWIVAFIATLAVSTDSPAADNSIAWSDHAARMELKYDLPPGLVRAVCEQESHWSNVVGAHGEIGVCQIKVDTVRMICSSCDGNANRHVFSAGSKGAAVLRIQGVLKAAGYYLGPLDGVFGDGTRTATVLYQQRNSAQADGIVGPSTWRLMFAEPYPGTSIADALWNPELNIEWAAKYLAWIRDTVSDDPMVMVGAYNGGPANGVVRYMAGIGRKLGAM